MRRSIFLAFFILSAGCLLATAQRQNSRTVTTAELRKLLSLPAPTPRVAAEFEKRDEKPPRPPWSQATASLPAQAWQVQLVSSGWWSALWRALRIFRSP